MRALRTSLAVLGSVLIAGAPAASAKNYAPPGKAGTSQYAEDIPSGGGNVSTPAMGTANKTATQIEQLGSGKAGVHKLAKLGKQGTAAAQFAQETAPTVHPTHGLTGSQPSSSAEPTKLEAVSGGSAFSGVAHVLTGSDSGGIGAFLPLLLAFSLGAAVAAVAVSAARGRRGSQPPA